MTRSLDLDALHTWIWHTVVSATKEKDRMFLLFWLVPLSLGYDPKRKGKFFLGTFTLKIFNVKSVLNRIWAYLSWSSPKVSLDCLKVP